MRYLLLSVIVVFGFIACNQPIKGKNGVIYKSAAQYNDYIIHRQNDLIKKIEEFGAVADTNVDSAETMLDQSTKEVEKMIIELQGMPAFKGDSALRDAAANSFSFYKQLFDNEYRAVLKIRKKRKENITEDDTEEVNKVVQDINKQEERFEKALHNAQKNFAEKNKMRLIPNKAQEENEKKF